MKPMFQAVRIGLRTRSDTRRAEARRSGPPRMVKYQRLPGNGRLTRMLTRWELAFHSPTALEIAAFCSALRLPRMRGGNLSRRCSG